ncbi:hypothetical protein BDV95DRAFT_557866 [Massariosphaeria phaeospora]|uniref:U4/U6.U5 small nuclear ribonucleoprotein 27kDa protein domain-containing protein n=1 Tax=Massariosphaeria phaeospora TaxID=100035 RepID=A0A7C8MLT0_9PLEO|nr:hypothetical protein BDV95DRAFT_557866 [Massariosphaeria phaeospora]
MATRASAHDTRDKYRDRDGARDSRDAGRDRAGTPKDRRDRSRSPRRERGGRRDKRYRSRSPIRRDREGSERAGSAKNEPEARGREPPKGPRGGGSSRGKPDHHSGGPVKPASTPQPVVKQEEFPDVDMDATAQQKPAAMDPDEWEMMQIMGFNGFKTTKQTKVPGNDKNYGVRRDKVLKARQYMNRNGGFNRPLSPSREAR